MTTKHARLASAVADAMLARNFTTKQVANFAGCTSSAVSSAISGRYDLREERWRLICENLGLDYEEIIKDPEPEELPPCAHDTVPAEIRGGTAVRFSEEKTTKEDDLPINEEDRGTFAVAARYMAGHLKEDIRKGMDISLEELYTLLSVCKRMQEAAENGT